MFNSMLFALLLINFVSTTYAKQDQYSKRIHEIINDNNVECTVETLDKTPAVKCVGTDEIEGPFDHLCNYITTCSSTENVVRITSTRRGQRFVVSQTKSLNKEFNDHERLYDINPTLVIDTSDKRHMINGFGTSLTEEAFASLRYLNDDVKLRLFQDYFNKQQGIGLNILRVTANVISHNSKTENLIKLLSTIGKDAKLLITTENLNSNDEHSHELKHILSKERGHDVVWKTILNSFPEVGSGAGPDSFGVDRYSNALSRLPPHDTNNNSEGVLLAVANRRELTQVDNEVFSKKSLASLVDGIAYWTNQKLSETLCPYNNLISVSQKRKDKLFIALDRFPESSHGKRHDKCYNNGENTSWQVANDYVVEIVKNLNAGANIWIDRAIASNACINHRGAIGINSRNEKSYTRNPTYYALGHLSRFIHPGSWSVGAKLCSAPNMFAVRHGTFVSAANNFIVSIFANDNEHPMPLRIVVDGYVRGQFFFESKSINTVLVPVNITSTRPKN